MKYLMLHLFLDMVKLQSAKEQNDRLDAENKSLRERMQILESEKKALLDRVGILDQFKSPNPLTLSNDVFVQMANNDVNKDVEGDQKHDRISGEIQHSLSDLVAKEKDHIHKR